MAISLVHRRLYGSGDVGLVQLDEYLASLLDQLKTSMQQCHAGTELGHDLEPLRMPTDASVNLGIVVAEWVTNASNTPIRRPGRNPGEAATGRRHRQNWLSRMTASGVEDAARRDRPGHAIVAWPRECGPIEYLSASAARRRGSFPSAAG